MLSAPRSPISHPDRRALSSRSTRHKIIEWRGKPKAIRCDYGPEYLSGALQEWAELRRIRIDYI